LNRKGRKGREGIQRLKQLNLLAQRVMHNNSLFYLANPGVLCGEMPFLGLLFVMIEWERSP
jgi:hypothetical protein